MSSRILDSDSGKNKNSKKTKAVPTPGFAFVSSTICRLVITLETQWVVEHISDLCFKQTSKKVSKLSQ